MANAAIWVERLLSILPPPWQDAARRNITQRAVAGVFLTLFSLWIIWGVPQLFPLYVLGFILLAVREWQRMIEPDAWQSNVHYLYSAILLIAIVQQLAGSLAALALIIILPFMLWLVADRLALARPLWFALSILYLAVPALALVHIQSHYTIGAAVLTFFFAVVWSTDTAAYFIGKQIGGARMAPDVSPQKTWSGFAGGLVAGTLVGFITATLLGAGEWAAVLAVSLLLSLAAQASDLVQSGIKRFYGIKDTGTLIPGHGGVWDRIDSLLLSAPIFVLLQFFLGRPVPW